MSLKVVVIGGGTGQGNLLRGLKQYTDNLTAIVTVADDGGGSGILRVENNILPPGDMRNCLLSLSNMDPALERLMKHRFKEGRLTGQNFGNLFILALSEIYGDMELAIEETTRMLGVQGRVLPVSMENIHLRAVLSNGEVVIGESKIAPKSIEKGVNIKSLHLIPEAPKANIDAINAIKSADIIVLGPGSLYTSIIANVLIPEIKTELKKSKALKLYMCNIMTENGETDGYNCLNHVDSLCNYLDGGTIDHILVNETIVPKKVEEKYINENQIQVLIDGKQASEIRKKGIVITKAKFLKINDKNQVIHDTEKVSKIIMDIAEGHYKEKSI
ncbi:MAG: gluconeogenesis factor YvcK family protein [Filifactoraceae bacterium]